MTKPTESAFKTIAREAFAAAGQANPASIEDCVRLFEEWWANYEGPPDLQDLASSLVDGAIHWEAQQRRHDATDGHVAASSMAEGIFALLGVDPDELIKARGL